MATTIVLYNQLQYADINGSWSFVGTQVSFPPAPATYNGTVNFSTYPVGTYVYRYTKTTNSVTHTSDVTINWQGSSPARQNDTCATAFNIQNPLNKQFSIIVEDDNRDDCPSAKAPSIPNPSDYPVTWNQGVYTGDLWYEAKLPLREYTYTLQIEISSESYTDEFAATGFAAQLYTNTISTNCNDNVSATSVSSPSISKTLKLAYTVFTGTSPLIKLRIASLKAGFFQITFTTVC
jgi:hypothetical protein